MFRSVSGIRSWRGASFTPYVLNVLETCFGVQLVCALIPFVYCINVPLQPQGCWATCLKLRLVLNRAYWNWMSLEKQGYFPNQMYEKKCSECSKKWWNNLWYCPAKSSQIVLLWRLCELPLKFQSEWIYPPSLSVIHSNTCILSQAIAAC